MCRNLRGRKMGSDGTVGRHRNLNRATFFSAASGLSIPGRTADTLTAGEAFFEQLNERGNAMNANTRMFTIAVLASTFATAAWAQELGRVHFQTSCTPQAQEKFDRALAMVHS